MSHQGPSANSSFKPGLFGFRPLAFDYPGSKNFDQSGIVEYRGKVQPEDLNQLFESVGWEPRDPKKWQEVLSKSSAAISFWEDRTLIAFARMVEDGINYTFHDGVVAPDYQNMGLMKLMMSRAVDLLEVEGVEEARLYAAPGTEAMYKGMGWEPDQTAMRARIT